MDHSEVSTLIAQVRANQSKANILSLSTSNLSFLLSCFNVLEEQSTSFNVKKTPNLKSEVLRDLQVLHTFFQNVENLKLYCDSKFEKIDISIFKKLTYVELCHIDVTLVNGLQLLKPQLQKIICHKTTNSLSDILNACGCWSELREAQFVTIGINELDLSFECAPWLHTLDLSHNQIEDFEILSCLPNLKSLNLSFNRLERVSEVKGQTCSRLQNLILKNNFIEDISGLRTLINLCLLDLSNNCLFNHKSLLTISHLATLQFLNLQNNPLSFHPNHRSKTASYLHTNTSSIHFVLDKAILTKCEKEQVGFFYPLQSKNTSLMTETVHLSSEKGKKVRHVVIEEENSIRRSRESIVDETSRQHLETKKQVEDLHDKFGESWLNSQSGLLDVLGLESPLVNTTSPYEADFTIYSGDFGIYSDDLTVQEKKDVEQAVEVQSSDYDTVEEALSEPDPDVQEEHIFLAYVKNDSEPIFIVIEETHLSEREISSGDEREKWHLDSILNCEILEDGKTVQINFETMRKDKKQRIYVFAEEIEAFVACVNEKITLRGPKTENGVKYQCMKCCLVFEEGKSESVLMEKVVKCPSCDSKLVVEHV